MEAKFLLVDALILSSNTSADPSPCGQHPRTAPTDLPAQPQVEKRRRADSGNSVHKNDQANDQPEGRMEIHTAKSFVDTDNL